jgi:CheY-like chemotaxis protein
MAKKRIIVVNDTEEILELFRDILEGEGGYEVIIATYKPQIIDQIEEANLDLIICDYVFGEEKVGDQLVEKLRMNRDTADIPIIVCSGAIQALRDMEGQYAEKNVSILYKPFDIDELLNLVSKKLSNSEDKK